MHDEQQPPTEEKPTAAFVLSLLAGLGCLATLMTLSPALVRYYQKTSLDPTALRILLEQIMRGPLGHFVSGPP
jgi:hypothetical protein